MGEAPSYVFPLPRRASQLTQLRGHHTQALFHHLQRIAKRLIRNIQPHQQTDHIVIRPRVQDQHPMLQAHLNIFLRIAPSHLKSPTNPSSWTGAPCWHRRESGALHGLNRWAKPLPMFFLYRAAPASSPNSAATTLRPSSITCSASLNASSVIFNRISRRITLSYVPAFRISTPCCRLT